MLNSERILVLAPHTDDGELGCGATLAKYAAAGKQVTYVAFSGCAASLPEGLAADTLVKECRAATKKLGIREVIFFDFPVREFPTHRQAILEALVRLTKTLAPQLVFLPAKTDVHQDHQVIYAEGLRACKHCNLLGYELPWNNVEFQPNYFETIDDAHLQAKREALSEYQSQAQRTYMRPDFSTALATVRGIQCNAAFAEAFELYRFIQ